MINLESAEQTKILRWLERQPATYVRKIIQANKAGTLDTVICHHGYFVAMEIKRHGKEADPLQKYNINQIHNADGFAFVVHSVEGAKQAIQTVQFLKGIT